MSMWTYVNGTITVNPMGRTNEEKEYILKTVLNHLPLVTGSEEDMNIYIIPKKGYNSSCSTDEFGEKTNNLTDSYGRKNRDRGYLQVQDEYIIVVNGALRDREFEQTYREFIKWIVRLGKRISIENILVEIKGYEKSSIIKNRNIQNKRESWKSVFDGLFEDPSWSNDDGKVNWTEFMMWDKAKDSMYPKMLAYKYFYDQENNKEIRKINYK